MNPAGKRKEMKMMNRTHWTGLAAIAIALVGCDASNERNLVAPRGSEQPGQTDAKEPARSSSGSEEGKSGDVGSESVTSQ